MRHKIMRKAKNKWTHGLLKKKKKRTHRIDTFFLRECQLMVSVSDDNSLLSNQDTNQFFV